MITQTKVKMDKNTENLNELQKPELGISDVIRSYLTKEKIILWFIIMPIFSTGFHLGVIITHISLNFSFEIPILVRLSGILTGIWLCSCMYLYVKNFK